MLGKSLATVGMPELQKAVMGMDPRIKPFEALAELQTRVKREKMKQAAQAQNPEQAPVAQRMMSEAAALQNPYMAGLAAAPVESPVGMAGGGIVAFEEGGEVPRFDGRSGSMVYAPYGFANTADTPQYTSEELLEAQRLREMGLGDLIGEKARSAYNWLTQPASQLQPKVTTRTEGAGIEARLAQGIADLESKTGRKLTEDMKNIYRQKEMAKILGEDKVGRSVKMEDLKGPAATATDTKAAPTQAPAGIAAATPRGAAGAGTGAPARVGLGATSYFDENKLKPLTDDERIASVQKYKKAMGAQNEEFLRPLQERLSKYETEAEEGKKGAMADALVQAGLGMMAGKSQYALQNIGEGGAAGLAALRESKKLDRAAQEKLLAAQGDMAKSRIALEKGDEQTAVALANQGRQEQQAAAQLDMMGKYYAGSNAAQMAAANAAMARANAIGGASGADKQRLNELKALQTTLQKQLDPKQNPMLMLPANAAEKASLQGQLAQVNAAIAQMAGLGTIVPQASPAGGGSGAKFLGFE